MLQRIAEIEAEIARTQKNKATESHIGLLKARLAKLKSEVVSQASKGSGGKGGDGFDVTKVGDLRVGMVGFPSVGKSSLLTKLTGTKSEVASYEFTTLTCIPGTINYRGARIQLLDMPGIIEGAKDGKGRGRQVISTARTCDVILIVLDAAKPLTHKKLIEHELHGFGVRLNQKPPNIVFTRKEKGGIAYRSSLPQEHVNEDLAKSICAEYRINNCEIQVREANITADDLIDVIEGNRRYVPCLYVLNKIDAISIEELDLLDKVPHYVPVSAHHEWNFDELLEKIWEYAGCIRIYTKPKSQVPDYSAPVVLREGDRSVEMFCDRIHRSIIKQFKYAWVWGRSVKHQPQRVGKDHVLEDEDIVQIVKK